MKEITVKFTVKFMFDESWSDYSDVNPEFVLEDAIRELADGVTYEIITNNENLKK